MPKGNWREFVDPKSTTREIKTNYQNPKSSQNVRVQKVKGGKKGKTVTVITGIELNDLELRMMLKKLKTSCGTGGTLKGGSLELQGDHIAASLVFLMQNGYSPKQSGG